MSTSMSMTGDKALIELFAKAGADGPKAAAAGTLRTAHIMMADSQPLVPVDTGTLRASGQVHDPVLTDSTVEVVFGYGGAARDYAIYVHERLDVHHAPGTQAKYLEVPVLRRIGTWQDELRREVENLL